MEPNYDGSRMEETGLTLEFVHDLIDRLRNQKKVHKRYGKNSTILPHKIYSYVIQILLKALQEFKQLKSLVYLDIPANRQITVCGDTHGQYYDLLNIFKLNGYVQHMFHLYLLVVSMPSPDNPYLFNGDFVDRGSFSVEVILTLLAFKAACPESLHLTRGNHESHHLNRVYGFEGEVKTKYTEQIYHLFQGWHSLGTRIILDLQDYQFGANQDGRHETHRTMVLPMV